MSAAAMVFDILCGEIPEVRTLENGPTTSSKSGGARRLAPRRSANPGSYSLPEEDLVSGK
jgi:hypothetical protein